jgi:hypothetical protein
MSKSKVPVWDGKKIIGFKLFPDEYMESLNSSCHINIIRNCKCCSPDQHKNKEELITQIPIIDVDAKKVLFVEDPELHKYLVDEFV